MLTLDVLICTYRPEGIRRVEAMDLPKIRGVRYVVSWQEHADAPIPPALKERSDLEVFRFGQKGLSYNRNNAIEQSTADILLIADDDCVYTEERLQAVRKTFDDDPKLDYASFMYEGAGDKVYPAEECSLNKKLPKGFFQSSIEIAFRSRGLSAKLRFHPAFGLGSPNLHVAEDEMFLLTARRVGLNCRFVPIVITTHRGESTGRRVITDPCVHRGTGAYIRFAYPLTYPVRIWLKAWRLRREGRARFGVALREMARGAWYSITSVTTPWREMLR